MSCTHSHTHPHTRTHIHTLHHHTSSLHHITHAHQARSREVREEIKLTLGHLRSSRAMRLQSNWYLPLPPATMYIYYFVWHHPLYLHPAASTQCISNWIDDRRWRVLSRNKSIHLFSRAVYCVFVMTIEAFVWSVYVPYNHIDATMHTTYILHLHSCIHCTLHYILTYASVIKNKLPLPILSEENAYIRNHMFFMRGLHITTHLHTWPYTIQLYILKHPAMMISTYALS
jgi:hypothetical protein